MNETAKMKAGVFRLAENRALTDSVRLLAFEGDCSAIREPGQFVSVELPGKFLRRPFSVCDWEEDRLTLIVERVGSGTELLHALPLGTELNILTGLGRGYHRMYDAPCATREEAAGTGSGEPGICRGTEGTMEGYGSRPLLVGGGSGLSPLVGLCRRLREAGVKPAVLLGFRDRRSRLGAEFFPGAELRYTEDVFPEMEIIPHDAVYACGSQAMMLELCRRETGPAQVAFDVRMGCGFGACMGCSLKTPSGMKRVCRDGPVFRKEELV